MRRDELEERKVEGGGPRGMASLPEKGAWFVVSMLEPLAIAGQGGTEFLIDRRLGQSYRGVSGLG